MLDEFKIKEVELKLDGIQVEPCPYFDTTIKGQSCSPIPGNSIFKGVFTELYFQPCKKHETYYTESIKNESWYEKLVKRII